MLDIEYSPIETEEPALTLSYTEIDYLVAFIRSHEWKDIPETIKGEILPKMENFLADSY